MPRRYPFAPEGVVRRSGDLASASDARQQALEAINLLVREHVADLVLVLRGHGCPLPAHPRWSLAASPSGLDGSRPQRSDRDVGHPDHTQNFGQTQSVRDVVEQIDESAWTAIDDYPDTGEAQIAEATLGGRRLIVRRVRLLGDQAEPRLAQLPVCDQPQREHRNSRGRAPPARRRRARHPRPQRPSAAALPLRTVHANAAWTVIAALAHNLLRWTALIGLPERVIRAARTLRRRLLTLPGRLTTHAGRFTLHLPARWPWQHDFLEALTRIRALPAAA